MDRWMDGPIERLLTHLHRPRDTTNNQVQDRWGLKLPAQMTLRTYASEEGDRSAAMLYLQPGPIMCVWVLECVVVCVC